MAFPSSSKTESNDEDYYSILGIPRTARLIEIKKAFRMKQRKVHPDSSKTDSTRSVSAKLNGAYQVLSNALSRLEYDLEHGFKEKNDLNLSKLQEFKTRKAKKMRENMIASSNRSREIESNVTSSLSDGTRIKNCGLIITKAKYGLIDIEQRKRFDLISNNNDYNLSSNPYKLKRCNTVDNAHKIYNITYKKHRRKINNNIDTGYDSATESITNNNKKKNKNMQHTIDVTDALQCMVIHRGQSGGYIEIDDNLDKSTLDGFYDPYPSIKNRYKRYLEIEYMFNRKYHYIKVNNFEYVYIPNQSHIVHLFDANDPYKYIKNGGDINSIDTFIESDDDDNAQQIIDEKTESVISNNTTNTTNTRILQSALSFATFSPVSITNNGKYSMMMATTSTAPILSNPNISDSDIINLPSGKIAIQSRASLSGLRKFSEIEKLRKENEKKEKENEINYNQIPQTTSNYHNNLIKINMRNKIIKWSVGLMIIGAIGGLGYYYVDKQQREQHQKNNINTNNNYNDGGIIGYLWQESIVSYIQKYWNSIYDKYHNNNNNNSDKTE